MASQQPPGESKTINISTKMLKWLHSSLLENPKPTIFKQTNVQMASQQPPGESKTINISTKKCANGFTATSWRIQNHKYLNKKLANGFTATSWRIQNNQYLNKTCANGFTAASWRIQNHQYFNKQIRKLLHNSLLENPKPSIFQQQNAQMVSQQPPGESKPINIATNKMRKWLHNNVLENPKP